MNSIPLSRPDIGPREIQAVQDVLRSGRLSIGPRLRRFEKLVARRAGRAFGIGVNSGTSGLHLCVRALGIGPEDEVITTPFTFVATANCFLYERARPVFVDIDPETYNLDPARIEQAITPRTKAIIPVEVFGNCAHFDQYEQIAAKHDLTLIEDSCEALGAKLNARPAGSFGQAGVFGFYPNKQITTGEGGVIVTDDAQLAQQCRAMANQGRSANRPEDHTVLGYNYRLSELAAALGVVQVERLDELLAARRRVAAAYGRALQGIDELRLPPQPADASWFVYVVRLAPRMGPEDRDQLIRLLGRRGIQCQKYFKPLHLQPSLQPYLPHRPQLPIAEAIGQRTLALPFFAAMSEEQIHYVAHHLKQCLQHLTGICIATSAKPAKQPASDSTRHR
jgi:perosamine synthetase